ncbi:MAG: TolC family protein [Myxococcales bacterium]
MLAALLSLALAAPAPLRLQDLLREAREKNPELRAAYAQARAASEGIAPAGALEDPMLMVQLWNAPIDLSFVPVMVQVSQNLPLGGKRGARRDAAAADFRAARANAAAKVRDVEAEIGKGYFDLFMADRTLAIDREIEGTLRTVSAAAEARLAAGRGEVADQLKAQAEILKVQAGLETAFAQRVSASARIAVLLDRDPAEPLGPTGTPALLPALPPESALRDRALSARSELKAAEAMTESAEAQLRLARAQRVPDLGVFGAVMHNFGNSPGERNFFFAGVQGNLPIFSGSKNGPRIAGAEAQAEAQRAAARTLRNKVLSGLAEVYARVVAEQHLVALHHKLIPLSRQALESSLSSYAAGRSPFFNVLDSERELQMHQLDLALHLASYEQQVAELEHAVGEDLGLAAVAEAGRPEAH